MKKSNIPKTTHFLMRHRPKSTVPVRLRKPKSRSASGGKEYYLFSLPFALCLLSLFRAPLSALRSRFFIPLCSIKRAPLRSGRGYSCVFKGVQFSEVWISKCLKDSLGNYFEKVSCIFATTTYSRDIQQRRVNPNLKPSKLSDGFCGILLYRL